MPLILAFDSSTDTCSVALRGDGRLLAQRSITRAHGFGGHSEHVLELVAAVMLECSYAMQDLDAVAFGAGPGAFTGLRVACAVAQGLGLGLGIPLVPVDCLSAIGLAAATHGHPHDGAQSVLVLQDARMGELYLELLDIDGCDLQVVSGPVLVNIDADLTQYCAADLICGSGLALMRAAGVAGAGTRLAGFERPEAASIAQLAEQLLLDGKASDASHAAPIYIRDRVALTIAQRAAGERLSS